MAFQPLSLALLIVKVSLIRGGTNVPTCAQMDMAIADAIAAIPSDDNQAISPADASIDIMAPTALWQEEPSGKISMRGTGASPVFPVTLLNTGYTTSGPSTGKTITGFSNTAGGDWIVNGATIDAAAFGGVARF
jgi:hypothetical protein